MYESNLSINTGGHWKAWGEFVETARGPKVAARSANSCAVGNCRENMYTYCADKS